MEAQKNYRFLEEYSSMDLGACCNEADPVLHAQSNRGHCAQILLQWG